MRRGRLGGAVGLAVGAGGTANAAPASGSQAGDGARMSSPGATGVRFATYNVRTSHLNNKWAGDPDAKYDRDDAARMERVATFIKNKNLHIIAVQEVRHDERRGIMKHLPKNFYASGVKGRSDTAIIWNAKAWKHLDTGRFDVRIRKTVTRPQVWMKLQHRRSGQRIVSSLHLAAGDKREHLRIAGAERTVRKMRRVANGLPFVVAGDINGNDRTRGRMGAYRVFKGAGLTYTRYLPKYRFGNHCDSHNGRAGHGKQECRANGRGSHIDMVFVSKALRVGSYNLVANARTSRTSDHNPLIPQLWVKRQLTGAIYPAGR
ncbi:MAG: hypothetical protein GEV07_23010 [Streptosporangiales bacterium]|nr:hypothetical protein [Streptosporangiales bacterium]